MKNGVGCICALVFVLVAGARAQELQLEHRVLLTTVEHAKWATSVMEEVMDGEG